VVRRYMNDQPTPDNIRALWDQIHKLTDQLVSAQATVSDQASTISTLQSQLTATAKKTEEALLTVGQPLAIVATTGTSTGGGASGPGGATGGTDDGFGSQGCSEALDDGHVAPGSPLTAITAGMIVCGTGREYSALKAVTVDLATRQANAEELIRRMIWHLQQAGFTAGRQNNSATGLRISNDKITVEISGTMRAYDVLGAYDEFTSILTTRMGQVFPARYIADTGVAD
jgi:hypothetical protein